MTEASSSSRRGVAIAAVLGLIVLAAVIFGVTRSSGETPPELGMPEVTNIYITCVPNDSTVTRADDGTLLGKTPMTLTLPKSNGQLTVVARAENYTDGNAQAEAGADNVEIKLMPAYSLRGRVTDAETGEPVHSFALHLQSRAGEFNVAAAMAEALVSSGDSFNAADGTFTKGKIGFLGAFAVISAVGYEPASQAVMRGRGNESRACAFAQFSEVSGARGAPWYSLSDPLWSLGFNCGQRAASSWPISQRDNRSAPAT